MRDRIDQTVRNLEQLFQLNQVSEPGAHLSHEVSRLLAGLQRARDDVLGTATPGVNSFDSNFCCAESSWDMAIWIVVGSLRILTLYKYGAQTDSFYQVDAAPQAQTSKSTRASTASASDLRGTGLVYLADLDERAQAAKREFASLQTHLQSSGESVVLLILGGTEQFRGASHSIGDAPREGFQFSVAEEVV